MDEPTQAKPLINWKHIQYALPLVWLLLILATLYFTSPLRVGPAGILLLFCLVYGFLNSLFFVLISLINTFFGLVKGKNKLPKKTTYYIASVLALGPIFMIALNTLGQLGVIEVVLVVLLVAMGNFYVLRRTSL